MVYTDRALNHMSAPFKKVMLDIGDMLKEVYHAENAVIIPGSGTYAMEAVARHFATNKKVMVLRNGYFSYRWTHIFETCDTHIFNGWTVHIYSPIEAGQGWV